MSGILFNDKEKLRIISTFNTIKDNQDFAFLLNYIERNSYNFDENLSPISSKSLYHLSKTKDLRYTEFFISKKSGGIRTINSPDNNLKRVLGTINLLFQIVFEKYAHYNSNGFLFGKDIRRNAIPHINKNYVLNMDIKDFFPSINFRRIKTVLELSPFNLFGDREQIAFIVANLCTYSNYLPQGNPTSPIISNLVTQKLDRKITKYCNTRKVKYTRYADDLTFSSNKEIFDENFIKDITVIVNEENFSVNEEKTRIRSSMERQEVTGLIVNQKLNIKREYFQKVRAMLNNWEKGGLSYAEREFKKHQPILKKTFNFREVLLGHLSFIKLVK
jgi:RNA-directed DNA polymerase